LKKQPVESIAAHTVSQADDSSCEKGFRLSRPKGRIEKSAGSNPESRGLDMGFFAVRAAAGPRQFLAVGKKVAATDASGRNNDTSLALGFDRPTDMGKMDVYFLLHNGKRLGYLHRIHFRPTQQVDHLLANGPVLFLKGFFFHENYEGIINSCQSPKAFFSFSRMCLATTE
jgi:hypothetical protein